MLYNLPVVEVETLKTLPDATLFLVVVQTTIPLASGSSRTTMVSLRDTIPPLLTIGAQVPGCFIVTLNGIWVRSHK